MRFRSEPARIVQPRLIALLMVPTLFAACENTDPKPDAAPQEEGDIVLTDAANYHATLTPSIKRVRTANKADLNICWNDIQKDLLCHPISAVDDIDSVNFLQISLSESLAEQYIAEGKSFSQKVTLSQSYEVDASPGKTCTKLSGFAKGTFNPATSYAAGSNRSYMLLFARGTQLGVGGLSMMFLQPSDDETNTEVVAPDGCDLIDFDADLTTVEAVRVPKTGPYVIDWSQVTRNGLGNTYRFSDINLLQLGFYQGETAASLQEKFVDLDRIATRFYEMALDTEDGLAHADLKDATSEKDGPFSGFDRTDGLWALALRCTDCQSPAPVIVAILNPS